MKHGLFRGNYFINISNLYSKFSAALWQLICGETYFPATYFFCLSPFLLYYICIDTVLVHFSGLIFEWEDFFLDRLIIESYTEESPVVCSRLVKFYILLQFFFFLMNSICQVICYDLLAFCFVLFHNVRNLFSWLLSDKRAPSDISCLCYFSLSPLSLWKQTNSRMAITNHCRPVPLLQIGDIGFVPHVNFHLLRGLDLSEVWRT